MVAGFLRYIASLDSRVLVEMQNDLFLRVVCGFLRKIHICID